MTPPHPPQGPADSFSAPRYSGLITFARLPRSEDVQAVDVSVVGIPFDSGVSYRPGARFGPEHIRAASRLLRPYNPALDVSPFACLQVADAGDIACNPFDIPAALQSIEEGILRLTEHQEQRVLALGGDHTVALGILRALNRRHGRVAVIHFDAHLDTWNTYFDAPHTHGTPFRRASEEGLLADEACMHVGIRGPLYDRMDLRDDETLGFQIVHCRDFERTSIDEVVDRIRRRVGEHPVYVSIDIDVLDPAHAPGTGTPEAGGMSSRELLGVLRGFEGLNVVGADVVEVSPAYDHADITAVAAAHVAYELLSLMALTPNKERVTVE